MKLSKLTHSYVNHDLGLTLEAAARRTVHVIALAITAYLWCFHVAAAIAQRLNGEAGEAIEPLPQDWLLTVPESTPAKPESATPQTDALLSPGGLELTAEDTASGRRYTLRRFKRKLPPANGF